MEFKQQVFVMSQTQETNPGNLWVELSSCEGEMRTEGVEHLNYFSPWGEFSLWQTF